jgi:hypothetical protein
MINNDAIAKDWAAISFYLNHLLNLRCDLPWTPGMEAKQPKPPAGWSVWEMGQWVPVCHTRLPIAMGFDLESSKERDGSWVPVLATAFGSDGFWYCWTGKEPLIPFPHGRILVTQDGARHDITFLSCTYSHPGKTLVLDIRTMAAAMNGIPPEAMELWTAFDGRAKSGGGAHPWVATATRLSLEDLAYYYLGEVITKDLKQRYKDTPYSAIWAHSEPVTLVGYCAQDTQIAVRVAARLLPQLAGSFMPLPESMVGMVRLSTACTLVHVAPIVEKLDSAIAATELVLKTLVEGIARAMVATYQAHGGEHPRQDLDWRELRGGKDKGKLRWFRDLEKANFGHDTVIAIQMLDLSVGCPLSRWPLIWNGSKFEARGSDYGRFPVRSDLLSQLSSDNPLATPEVLQYWAEQREKLGELRHVRRLVGDLHVVNDGIAKLPARPGDVAHCPECPLLPWVMEYARENIVLPEGKTIAAVPFTIPDFPQDGPTGRTTLNRVLPPECLTDRQGMELEQAAKAWWKNANRGDAIHSIVAARPGARLLGCVGEEVFYEVDDDGQF